MVSDENRLTPEMLTLEHRLRVLLKEWWKAHSSKDHQKAKIIVNQYHTVLESLFELGYNMPLDMDDELPKHLMPKEYLERFPESQVSAEAFGDFNEYYENLYNKTGDEFYNLQKNKGFETKGE